MVAVHRTSLSHGVKNFLQAHALVVYLFLFHSYGLWATSLQELMNSSAIKCSLLVFSCSIWYAEASVIDSAYRSKSSFSSSVTQQIYSNVLKAGYYTDCTMIPTDSRYVSSLSQKCGMARAMVKGVGRFFNEPDAGLLGFKRISGFKKMSYEDQATDCDMDL